MSTPKKQQSRGLGRGFESLIPVDLLDETFDPTAQQDEQVSELRYLKLSTVTADPDQPRRVFDDDALEELAASIKEHGILQPIVVIAKGDGYQIVAGERRFRASKMAGLDTIPALVRTLTDQHRLELSLIENLQRRDLNAIETATAYLKLRDQFNLSLDQIGKRVGSKSASAVSNTLRLLRLPKRARRAIAEGQLTEGQARPLIGQDDDFINKILPKIIAEEWSARRVEQYMVSQRTDITVAGNAPVVDETARSFSSRLGTPVNVRTNGKGAGQIVIKFKNQADFERLRSLIDRD